MDAGVPIKAPRGRRGHGPDQGCAEHRQGGRADRHPGSRGLPRRHGLQGGGHRCRASPPSRWTSRSRALTRRFCVRRWLRRYDGRMHILGKMLEVLPAAARAPERLRAEDHPLHHQPGEDRRGRRTARQDDQQDHRRDGREDRHRGRRQRVYRDARTRLPPQKAQVASSKASPRILEGRRGVHGQGRPHHELRRVCGATAPARTA